MLLPRSLFRCDREKERQRRRPPRLCQGRSREAERQLEQYVPSSPYLYPSNALTISPQKPEEEKKILAALFSKLYVSPASSEEKIRDVYADVCEAVDAQLLADATSRNALYKIHVALGKIVNNLDAAAEAAGPAFRRSVSRATSLGVEDKTVLSEERTVVMHSADIKEEEEEGEDEDDMDDSKDGTTIMRTVVEGTVVEDSLVDDLLTDEEES